MTTPSRPPSEQLLTALAAVIGALALIVSIVFSPLFEGNEVFFYIALALTTAMVVSLLWRYLAQNNRIWFLFGALAVSALIAVSASSAFALKFEINLLNATEGAENTIEITDNLMDVMGDLSSYGISADIKVEIIPTYRGRRRYSNVVLKLGRDDSQPARLWDVLDRDTPPTTITISLQDIVARSGIQYNNSEPASLLRTGETPFKSAELDLVIVREAKPFEALGSKIVTVRNTPWEQRIELVRYAGQPKIIYAIQNLGSAGEFGYHANLSRMDQEIGDCTHPVWCGTTVIGQYPEKNEFFHLAAGQSEIRTLDLPTQYDKGRYVVEFFIYKKEPYLHFEDVGLDWENFDGVWLFSDKGKQFIMVFPSSNIATLPAIQEEVMRVKTEAGVDLGDPLGQVEEVRSPRQEAAYQHQVFEHGEVFVRDGHGFALYGELFRAYQTMASDGLGFPTSRIEPVVSFNGTQGLKMEFEGQRADSPSTLYVSPRGPGMVGGWIATAYKKYGGPADWLGFPISTETRVYNETGVTQLFENGYIVKYNPLWGDERYWNHEPVAYPYAGMFGNLVDVDAGNEAWTDTGTDVSTGDTLQFFQMGGGWKFAPNVEWHDANGALETSGTARLPSVPVGSLIGRIGEGEDAQVFWIGRLNTIRAARDGRIYLCMNDGLYGDNEGVITVQVNVE